MPDFDDIEHQAKEHGLLIDAGVVEVEKEADRTAGGQDDGPIDKAAEGVEKDVDGQKEGE